MEIKTLDEVYRDWKIGIESRLLNITFGGYVDILRDFYIIY